MSTTFRFELENSRGSTSLPAKSCRSSARNRGVLIPNRELGPTHPCELPRDWARTRQFQNGAILPGDLDVK